MTDRQYRGFTLQPTYRNRFLIMEDGIIRNPGNPLKLKAAEKCIDEILGRRIKWDQV